MAVAAAGEPATAAAVGEGRATAVRGKAAPAKEVEVKGAMARAVPATVAPASLAAAAAKVQGLPTAQRRVSELETAGFQQACLGTTPTNGGRRLRPFCVQQIPSPRARMRVSP